MEARVNDDASLLSAWATGDRGAGAALVERHYDAVVRFFRNKAGDDADDLVQRTFLACAEAAGRHPGVASVRAFLFGIARNVLYEHIRGRMRAQRIEPDFRESAILDLSPGVSTVAARRAEQRTLLRALQHIPVELQLLLELYYWEGLGIEELAQVLEVPPGTVKSRLFRARGLLREAISKVESQPAITAEAEALLETWGKRVGGLLAEG
jgi:RNA polymerase sigma-70 factor (ECF subfamily)